MHLNFYFLKILSERLKNELQGKILVESFSQNKNEFILKFSSDSQEFWVRASLDPGFTCLSFPETFHRAKKNSVDLFDEIQNQVVKSVQILGEDRIISIDFENEYSLILTLFGNQSNALIAKQGVVENQFNKRKKLPDLHKTRPDEIPTVTIDAFSTNPSLSTHFPKLRGLPSKYFDYSGMGKLPVEKQWKGIQSILSTLQSPKKYYLIRIEQQLHLSLLEMNDIVESSDDVIEISNKFFQGYITETKFQQLQSQLLNQYKASASKATNTIRKAEKRLDQLNNEVDFQLFGDLLMANLHDIPKHKDFVELARFDSSQKVKIKLKPTLSAQKNAENFYRKAKSQHLEIENLTATIARHKISLGKELQLIEKVEKCKNLKELKVLGLVTKGPMKAESDSKSLPYIQREIDGHKILIGKNAKSNDVLLSKHAKKDDLWFHVKDAAGSHVILKQSTTEPSPVLLEKVASIAAHYSKRKTEGLVPVAYTFRKYVRKRKGDPPGLVVVEKEKTLLVPPVNIS